MLSGLTNIRAPLRRNDGRFLRLRMSLALGEGETGQRLKVLQSSYQYQVDEKGDDWIFRYDYLREPIDNHPSAHLQVRGRFTVPDALRTDEPLERVHFATGRVSLEAIVRVLVGQFLVPSNNDPEIWMPVLSESEKLFAEIAHHPRSGPEGP